MTYLKWAWDTCNTDEGFWLFKGLSYLASLASLW